MTTSSWFGYSLKGIRQHMAFSVNIPSLSLATETDYCGIVSGANRDKVKDCGFKLFFGKNGQVPLIEQCPVNHVCEVIEILNLQSHLFVIGKIVETYLSEDCLTDGRPDVAKVKPFLFGSRKYLGVGEWRANRSSLATNSSRKAKPRRRTYDLEGFWTYLCRVMSDS